MLINTEIYNRYLLSPQEKVFLKKLVPLAYIINEWTWAKASFLGIDSPYGVLPSIIIADILLMSERGSHPVSRPDCNSKYSNNLALLQSDSRWTGKSNVYEGISYKAFKTYRDFAECFSDDLTFSRLYDDLLKCSSYIDQTAHLSLTKPNPILYSRDILTISNELGLNDFDRQIQQR